MEKIIKMVVLNLFLLGKRVEREILKKMDINV